MFTPPSNPKIYHITHLRNLAGIVQAGAIYSDAKRLASELDCAIVGMSKIKRRRLTEIEVTCHAGTMVGQYAPFYFCPRSIMLYILRMGNHPELNYTEGQGPIVHLCADLTEAVRWATKRGVRWAVSDGNAGSFGANFYTGSSALAQVNWPAIATNKWTDPEIKEGKQAEFLMWDEFPWTLIEKVGVYSTHALAKATEALAVGEHVPTVKIESSWYY